MNRRGLRLRLRALFARRRVERDLAEELEFHIERETQKYIDAGVPAGEARVRARARFGPTALAADRCRDVHGTTFVDGCVRDVRYAVRTIYRAPLVALTIIGTIAVGLGLVASAFTIFNALVFRADAVQEPDRLYSVVRPQADGERPRFTRPQFEALRRDTDVFVDAFARLSDITSRIDGRITEGQLVTGNFFAILGVGPYLGRTLTPADDGQGGQRVVVLSHSGWTRLYAADPAIVGRTTLINGHRFEIVGVTPERFRGLGLPLADYWAPLSRVGDVRPWLAGRENMVAIDVVGRLKPDVSPRAASAALTAWGRGGGMAGVSERSEIRLESRGTAVTLSPGVVAAFSPLFLAFGLILAIGCANVANLLLARAVARQREIGIRLSLGASRARIVRQLFTESLLLALTAAAGGLMLSRVLIDATLAAVMRTMPPELAEMVRLEAPATDWRVALFLILAAVVATALFGLVPAVQATRVDLVRSARGELARDVRPGRARNALVVMQVTAAALLLVCAAVFLRSAQRAAAIDSGLRTADTMVIDIVNEPLRTPMVAEVSADPLVAGVAATWPEPLSRPRSVLVSASASAIQSTAAYRLVSPEYFSLLDIPVIRGRPFTAAEASSKAPVVMVSEALARELSSSGDVLGQVIRVDRDQASEPGQDALSLSAPALTVVGVVRDVPGFQLAGFPPTGLYAPATSSMPETSLVVRVLGDPEAARRSLLDRLTRIDPNMGMVVTLRTIDRLQTYPLQIVFWLTMLVGALALVLTLSGVFGVLSYLVEQRMKEIGVRLALGATPQRVVSLVLRQSLRLVSAGLFIGGVLAASLATALMATPVAERLEGIVQLLDPAAYAASLAFVLIACALAASIPALRAGRVDPMVTLRQE